MTYIIKLKFFYSADRHDFQQVYTDNFIFAQRPRKFNPLFLVRIKNKKRFYH